MPTIQSRILPALPAVLGMLFVACASDSGDSSNASVGTTTPTTATGGRSGSNASGGAPTTTSSGGTGDLHSGGSSVASGGRSVATGGRASAMGGSPSATGGNGVTTGGSTAAAATGGAVTATGGKQSSSSAATGGVVSASGGSKASGGTRAATGGNASTGGSSNAAATGGTSSGTNPSPGKCGSTTLVSYPFGCKFAWGAAEDKMGSPSSATYLQFASTWVDSTISAAGKYTTCNACTWLTNSIKSTNLIPAYYAYIIGFLGHANGIVDGNQTGGKKLTTDGAALVKANRQAIVDAYGWYAKETYKVWPSKPLVWLLEGDFVQLVDSGQSSPLSYSELSSLVVDITCAIKSGMPNAVVAIDHSSWNPDDTSKKYWDAMKPANYDLVWTTGVGNNKGFLNADGNASAYNGTTAKYSWLKSYTGKPILVDTSAGASAAGDTWSSLSVADLNARISEGVIAANITGSSPSSANISKLSSVTAVPGCQ